MSVASRGGGGGISGEAVTPGLWASAHKGKWGQLIPPGKMDEKLKSENVQKEQFSEWRVGMGVK